MECKVANSSQSKRKTMQVRRQDYMLLNHQMTRYGCQNQLDTSHGQHQGHQHQDKGQIQGQGQTITSQDKTGEYGTRKSVKSEEKSHKHLRLQSNPRARSSSRLTLRSSSISPHRPSRRCHATKPSKSNRHRRGQHSSSRPRSKSRSPSRSRSHRTEVKKVHRPKDHQVRGPVSDLFYGQCPVREKGQGHTNQEDQRNTMQHLLIPTFLIDITGMGTLENTQKVYVLRGNQTGDRLKRGLTVIER